MIDGTETDEKLQEDVVDALRQVSTFSAAHIGVSAIAGAVTLMGEVDTPRERFDAVEATQAIDGVLAVADELHVRDLDIHDRNDTEIAIDAARALASVTTPNSDINVDVVDHSAYDCAGVRKVTNHLHVLG